MKNKLKQFRKLFALTQEQLGELVGVSRQAINSIETGKFEPSIWLAYDIAKVFKSTIEEIFIFEESQRKSRAEQSRGVV
nr:helix-turn-helix transcriptional regulator [Sedimentibacter sp.]